jgi:alcohol dehydrogenase (cytochrome c)
VYQVFQGTTMKRLMSASCLSLLFVAATATAFGASTATNLPDAKTLLSAPRDEVNWSLPAKTYAGNRYTALTQIDRTNVDTLGVAWTTSIADDGQQEASPIIWTGTMYLSAAHDGVLALNASNGKLL